jgi:hypothetical protein
LLSRRTIIVLGAGASFELGLPLGVTLKDDISSVLNITFPDGHNQKTGDYQITEFMRECARERNARSINDLLAKCWLIRDAMPASISIDNLLDAHRSDPDIAILGKLAIAKTILNAERSSKLFHNQLSGRPFPLSDVAGTWLLPMFQLLTEGVAKEDAGTIFDNVTFVVFNYDRCLEVFLAVALKAYYGFTDGEASEITKKATIIHPYGRVGEFGEGVSLATVAFGADRYNLRKVAEGIRTFSEGLRYDSYRDKIQDSVAEADQIVFLGFAFHPLNMEILSVTSPSSITKVFGTTVGLSDAAVRSVESDIYSALKKMPPTTVISEDSHLELSEMNLETRNASDFLFAHFRGIS